MTRVYVDRELLGGAAGTDVDLDAVRSLDILEETGIEAIPVSGGGALPDGLGSRRGVAVTSAPLQPDEPAWYVTIDVDRCRGRSARLQTVLVGTTPAASIHRCDRQVRDLRAAVLEILASEAMPQA